MTRSHHRCATAAAALALFATAHSALAQDASKSADFEAGLLAPEYYGEDQPTVRSAPEETQPETTNPRELATDEGQTATVPAQFSVPASSERSQGDVPFTAKREDGFEKSAEAATDRNPLFVLSPVLPSSRSVIFGVAQGTAADFVLIDNGFDQGFRVGAILEVVRDGAAIAELQLIEVRADRSAAVITSMEAGYSLHFNDIVRIKTKQF